MDFSGKGSYLLIFRLPETVIFFGKKFVTLQGGFYFYAGSALGSGGLNARICRHLQSVKKIHWHIDLITAVSKPVMILVNHGDKSYEHDYIRELLSSEETSIPVMNFGNGDCDKCPSHLVFMNQLKSEYLEEFSSHFPGMRFFTSRDHSLETDYKEVQLISSSYLFKS